MKILSKIFLSLLWILVLPIILLAVGFAGNKLWSIDAILNDALNFNMKLIYRVVFFTVLAAYLYFPYYVWKKK